MQRTITENGTYEITGTDETGETFLISWWGTAANGNLRCYTTANGLRTPVPDGDITIGELDGDGNERHQAMLASKGAIDVVLSGATGTINLEVQVS